MKQERSRDTVAKYFESLSQTERREAAESFVGDGGLIGHFKSPSIPRRWLLANAIASIAVGACSLYLLLELPALHRRTIGAWSSGLVFSLAPSIELFEHTWLDIARNYRLRLNPYLPRLALAVGWLLHLSVLGLAIRLNAAA